MPRFIDADKFIERIKVSPAFPNMGMDGYFLREVVINMLGNMPTADVVPKSEYDAVVSAVDNSTNEFLRLHDAYQNAKTEVETLKDTNEHLAVMLMEAKQEVAREIFEEIDKLYEQYGFFNTYRYAELKKKYTEVDDAGK